MEGNLFRSDAQQAHDGGFIVKQKANLITGATGGEANESGCFDCNICLDTAHDPVVTLCGHLFCWPCIYRWLHVQLSSISMDQHQNNCPVCKSNITITSLVPLYGRGMSSSSSTFGSKKHIEIPRRPAPSTLNYPITAEPEPSLNHQTLSPTFHNHQYSPRGFTTTESTDLANAVMMSFLYPVIGMFGDMVYTRIFGTFTNTIAQPYQSQRMMQREKSLHRVSIFLFCCIVLCLLFF